VAELSNCSASADLTLSDITRSSFLFLALTDEFQVDPMPAFPTVLGPGETLPLTVTYTPLLAGPDSGYFILHTDDPNASQLNLDVSGVGTEPPPEEIGLTIQLEWDTNDTDVDSHLYAPGGTFFDCELDCHFGNPSPEWGDPTNWQDNPYLDVDDVDGYGPEHINISEPEAGLYTYVVHYYDDTFNGFGASASSATVRVLSYGVEVATFGPVFLDVTNRNWDVFTIDWPSGTITELGDTYMVPDSAVNFCGTFPW